MGKPVNIGSTSHAQAAEVAAILGGGRSDGQLQALLEQAERQNNDDAKAISELQVLNAALQTDIDTVTAERDELTAKVEALEAELEATSAKLAAAGANVDELNAEIAALKTATTNAKKK